MVESNKFEHLQMEGWRQFDYINIKLHPRLTVITGANGSGKSTLLNVLTLHFGWSRPYLSVPSESKSGTLSYLTGIASSIWTAITRIKSQHNDIGSLTYSNKQVATIIVPASNTVEYAISLRNQQQVSGISTTGFWYLRRFISPNP
jgi:predicted ATP-dependent endonuclease of OLD family